MQGRGNGANFCAARPGADVYVERPVENFAAAANEAGLDGGERPAATRADSRRAPRNYRRHLSFAQHARATGAAEIPRFARRAAGAIAAENLRESHST